MVRSRRSLFNTAVQTKESSASTPGPGSSNISPAGFDKPVRNRPVLGGEQVQTQPYPQLVGQRHISTERPGWPSVISGSDCSAGTHPGLRSWPRPDAASEDAASIRHRLLLNHSAVKQVSTVHRVDMRYGFVRSPPLCTAVCQHKSIDQHSASLPC